MCARMVHADISGAIFAAPDVSLVIAVMGVVVVWRYVCVSGFLVGSTRCDRLFVD